MNCRVRFGYAHVVNNKYDEWKMYAIGGSANPTILSEGNFFIGPNDQNAKQVETNKHSSKNYKYNFI